jgi:hypothetical protein
MAECIYCANLEPSIEELLNDHIAALLMRRDGVRPGEVIAVMEAARQRCEAASRGSATRAFHRRAHAPRPIRRATR